MREIVRAQNHLSIRNCQTALKILKKIDGKKSARWYQTKASAEACSSPFSEVSFFTNGVQQFSANQQNFGRSLAGLDISSEKDEGPEDSDFVAIFTSVQTLLNAGKPKTPNFKGRSKIWDKEENIRMSMQGAYVNLAALGMYMNYYGNVDEKGNKGEGEGANGCYLDYTSPYIVNILIPAQANLIKPCASGGSGHPDLPSPIEGTTLTRACRGIVMVNALLDFIDNVELPDDSGELNSLINLLRGRLLGGADSNTDGECKKRIGELNTNLGTNYDNQICSTTSVKECEELGTMDSSLVELHFFVTFEFLHRGA